MHHAHTIHLPCIYHACTMHNTMHAPWVHHAQHHARTMHPSCTIPCTHHVSTMSPPLTEQKEAPGTILPPTDCRLVHARRKQGKPSMWKPFPCGGDLGLNWLFRCSQSLSPVLLGTHSMDGSQEPSPPGLALRYDTVPFMPGASLTSPPEIYLSPRCIVLGWR